MRISKTEIAYRGTDIKSDDALMDTFQAAACIASRGKMDGEYKLYVGGIRDLRGHIFAENYSPEIAAVRVTKIMYAAACLRHDAIYERVSNAATFADRIPIHEHYLSLRYLRKVNSEAYAYVIKADELM